MAGEKVLELTDANFDETVKEGVSVVDFWATWCGPCQMQGPIIDAVAEKLDGKAKVGKVNVDENTQVAAKFGIRSIPTLLIMKDGELVQQLVGLQQEAALIASVDAV